MNCDCFERFLCLAYRIHSSETTADLLEEIGGFHLEYRGVTEIKVGFSANTSAARMNSTNFFRVEEITRRIG